MKKLIVLGFTLSLMSVTSAFSQIKNDPAAAEKSIKEVRAKSNRAIAEKDTATLGRTWTHDFHLISSRNAEVSGRKANQLNFAREFEKRPDVLYIRTPTKIEVNEAWNMAAEQGLWTGTWTDGQDKIVVKGTYFAKWHYTQGQWLIRAELFIPLQCAGGSFCASRAPCNKILSKRA